MRLVKTIGDAVMLVSPDTDALLAMLLELNDAAEAGGQRPARHPRRHGPRPGAGPRRRRVRAAVNKASRIAQFARPGSVLAARRCDESATGDYAWSFAGRRRLKGLAEPVSLYRVRRPPPPERGRKP